MSSSKLLKRFYNSKEWQVFRQQIILQRRQNGFIVCQHCGKRIVVSKHIQVHHKIELTEENYLDKSISLNPNNVEVWCHICHNKHHNRFCGGGHKRKEKAIYVVYGPPLSGKTSYVIEHMERGDIIVDMDRLYNAVSFFQMYDKPDNLKYNVFAIRNALIENIRTRYGGFRTAWIVGGYPSKMDRDRLERDLGAKLVYMDIEREECYKRLENLNDYRAEHKEEWKKYIDKWFEQYF